jgi:hypothetical protein
MAISQPDHGAITQLERQHGGSGRAPVTPTACGWSSLRAAGAQIAVRYAVRLGSFELAAGPRAEIVFRPIAISVDEREAFRIPALVVGAIIDASFPAAPERR